MDIAIDARTLHIQVGVLPYLTFVFVLKEENKVYTVQYKLSFREVLCIKRFRDQETICDF